MTLSGPQRSISRAALTGVYTLKPLSYEEFRSAYVQPSMRDVKQEDEHFVSPTDTTGMRT